MHWRGSLLTIVFTLAVWSAWQPIQAQLNSYLPIRYVRVEGVFDHISRKQFQEQLKPLVTTGFLSADMQKIHQAALALPWVKVAEISRVWPDAITITLHEQQAVVRWGKNGLLNRQGELFTPPEISKFGHLALINGPQGQEKKLFKVMAGLEQALSGQRLQLKEFNVSARRSWAILLNNGMQIKLGRKEPKNKFQQLIKVLPVIGTEIVAKMAVVDLRYPNGFAVTWKPGIEINWQKEIKHRSDKQNT